MIRWLLNTLGLLCLLVTLAVLGNEVWQAATSPGYRIVPLGELWASLHANSLVGLQTKVEATSPWLWRTIVLPILLGPAWAFSLGLALLLRLLAAFAPRPRRRDDRPRRTQRSARWRKRLSAPARHDDETDADADFTAPSQSPWAEAAPVATSASPAEPRQAPAPQAPRRHALPTRVRQPTVVRRS